MSEATNDEYLDDDPSDESEDDVRATASDVSSAVVAATDWTTETIINQLRRGNFELNPSFQRRDAWTLERKSRFIESILMGIPIPQLVLAERSDRRGSYIVIDGKQRLLALTQYASAVEGSPRNGFKLERMSLRPELNGVTYEQMLHDPLYYNDLNAFENATIRTVLIRNAPSEQFLHLVFHRLNTGSVPLSPQELRQALHPGPFTEFVDGYSFQSEIIRRALNLRGPDFRMRDAELLTRAFAFYYFIDEYNGNLKQFLDTTCERLNSVWDTREEEIRGTAISIERAITAVQEGFGEHAFRRYGAQGYESRFNRAVFDVETFFLTDERVANAFIQKASEMEHAFRSVSTKRDFSESVGATTKSVSATFTRLHRWADAMRAGLGGGIPRVSLVNNRIHVS